MSIFNKIMKILTKKEPAMEESKEVVSKGYPKPTNDPPDMPFFPSIKRCDDRIDPFLEQLATLWKAYPQQRFGQFLFNILASGKNANMTDAKFIGMLYNMEEEDWIKAFENWKDRT